MSFDLRIYLAGPSFPPGGWQDVLGMVGAEEVPADGKGMGWRVACDDSSVWIDVEPVCPAEVLCGPPGTHWLCTVSTSAGRSLKAFWTQFALAYYALLLVEGASVHDCQHHDCGRFEGAAAFLDFASRVMPKLTRKRTLIRQGLMTGDGRMVF